jgi:hypothetical protein
MKGRVLLCSQLIPQCLSHICDDVTFKASVSMLTSTKIGFTEALCVFQ